MRSPSLRSSIPTTPSGAIACAAIPKQRDARLRPERRYWKQRAQQLEKTSASKRKAKPEKIGSRVGRVLQRYKMGKFVNWSVQEGKLQWHFKEEEIAGRRAI